MLTVFQCNTSTLNYWQVSGILQNSLVPICNFGRENYRIFPQLLYYAPTFFCLAIEIVMNIAYKLCIDYEEEALHLEPLYLGVIEQAISWHLLMLNLIELNWITLFKVSFVILKLHNSSHLLRVCLNNANRPKLIMIITIKIKE